MGYSCTDFTDTILDALHIDVPVWANDNPSDQADFALDAIERFERLEKAIKNYAVAPFIATAIGSRNPVVCTATEELNEALKPLPALPAQNLNSRRRATTMTRKPLRRSRSFEGDPLVIMTSSVAGN
jgi:hypothetical protein